MTDHDDLLAETLGDGDGANFARRAAAHTRRRRTVSKLALAGVAATAVVVAVLGFLRPSPESPVSVKAVQSTVEIISDEELLAELKNESVLILKNGTGISGIVFLADSGHSRGPAR
jgi:hypothetical protein